MAPGTVMLALLLADPVTVLSVRAEPVPGGQALTILTAGEPADVSVAREEGEVVISLKGAASAALAPPVVSPPLEGVRIEKGAAGLIVRVRVAPDVPYQVQRNRAALTVVFGAAASPEAAEAQRPGRPSVADLYKLIMPPPSEVGQFPGAPEIAAPKEAEGGGLGLGRLRLNPSAAATYVDATSSVLQTPQPVSDRYYEIDPRLAARLPLGTGRLTADYTAHLRRGSAYDVVRETGHFANGGLELPLGPSVDFRVSEHFARSTLEANEVDPGGEFFFDLGRFTRNSVAGGLRIHTAGRLDLDLGGSFNKVDVAQGAGFFSYESRGLAGSLGYEASPTLRAALAYSYERVPSPPDRPEAASRAHTVGVQVDGDILPLLTGHISLGYRDQESPRAGAGGQRYRGLDASVSLTQEFTRGARLSVSGSRSTPLSAFEENAFYVSSALAGDLSFALPLGVSGRGGAGYRWNDYKTVAAGIGEPRRDRIFGWSVGLGRGLTRWSYLRVDYRKDRRRSDLDVFATRTHSLTVQLGVGLFDGAGSR